MTKFETVRRNLEKNGFAVSCFASAEEACRYLEEKLDGKTIGHGGSMTLQEMGLLDRLAARATLYHHQPGDIPAGAATAQVYLCSVNALAETGEIVNIDGAGNRVASTMFGHEELYLVVGRNKIAPDCTPCPQCGRAPKRPEAGEKDPLRGPGGQVLRL